MGRGTDAAAWRAREGVPPGELGRGHVGDLGDEEAWVSGEGERRCELRWRGRAYGRGTI